jgi:hypothetical protein
LRGRRLAQKLCGMVKLLIYIALAFAVFWLLRRAGIIGGRRAAPRPRQQDSRELNTTRCAECGVYLPQENAVRALGKDYCDRHAPRSRA